MSFLLKMSRLPEVIMKHRVRVQVPVVKRGLFGRKKVVYVDRTVVVDGRTYRRMKNAQRNQQTDSFVDFVDRVDTMHAIFDD